MSDNIRARGQEAAVVDRRAHKPAKILDTGLVYGDECFYGLPGLYFPEGRWREIQVFWEFRNEWCLSTDSTKDRIQKNILMVVRCARFYLQLDQWNGWLYAVARDLAWDYKTLYIAFYTVMAARVAYKREVIPHDTDYQPDTREAAILAEIDAWKEEEWEYKPILDDKAIRGRYKAKIWAARSLVVDLVEDEARVKNLVESYPIYSCLTGGDCGWPCHMPPPIDNFYPPDETDPLLEVDDLGRPFKDLNLEYYVGPDCKLYGVDLFGVFFDLDDLKSHGNRWYGFDPVGVVERPDGSTTEYSDGDEDDVEEEEDDEVKEQEDEDMDLDATLDTHRDCEGITIDMPHGDNMDFMEQDDLPSVDQCNPHAQSHSDRRLRSRTRSRSPTATIDASRRARSPLTLPLRPRRG